MLEDEVVSMVDVLDEDNELEEEARAVLGDSDDKNCTYLSVSSVCVEMIKAKVCNIFGCDRFPSDRVNTEVYKTFDKISKYRPL